MFDVGLYKPAFGFIFGHSFYTTHPETRTMKKIPCSCSIIVNGSMLLLIFAFILSSCSKGDDGGTYHITCKIDGVATSFNTAALAHIDVDPSGPGRDIIIHGLTGGSAIAGTFGFALTNVPGYDSIKAGVYPDTQTKYEVLASYSGNVSSPDDYEAGTSNYQEAVRAGVVLTNHFTLTITSLNAQAVSGTFNGDFYFNGDVKGAKKSITNGDFYVKLQ
jgi:hypothetical protein